MLIMISCRHASELMSLQLDRPLKLNEKLRLKAHLMICRSCPKTLLQFEVLHRAAQQYTHRTANRDKADLTLSPESKQRILEKLHAIQSSQDQDQ